MVAEGGVVDLVNQDTEESGSLITRVGTQLRVNLDDEGRGHCRKQTSLVPVLARVQQRLTRDQRKSGWCPNLHRIFSGTPCRTRQPPCGTHYRNELDSLESGLCRASGCKAALVGSLLGIIGSVLISLLSRIHPPTLIPFLPSFGNLAVVEGQEWAHGPTKGRTNHAPMKGLERNPVIRRSSDASLT